jgi:hypothetical protein
LIAKADERFGQTRMTTAKKKAFINVCGFCVSLRKTQSNTRTEERSLNQSNLSLQETKSEFRHNRTRLFKEIKHQMEFRYAS